MSLNAGAMGARIYFELSEEHEVKEEMQKGFVLSPFCLHMW